MPKTHVKPTKAELEEGIKQSLAELDTPETQETAETPEPPKETPEPKETEIKETQEEEPKVEEEEVDYRKKFTESSREAQVLYSKNKKMAEAIERAGEVAEPTDDELKAEYAEWEDMSDFERRIAKENLINKRRFDAISEATKDFKDMDAWNGKVDDFLADPETLVKYPELDGLVEEFKIFTAKPTRRGVDFDDLISAFLFEREKIPGKKGRMFETGSSGGTDKPQPKSDKISTAESMRLRQTDYKKYLEFLRAGKIENDVE